MSFDEYVRAHPGTVEVLSDLPPEATVELVDIVDAGDIPTIGWWRKWRDR